MLSGRERKALMAMSYCHYKYELKGQLGLGVGAKTLEALVQRGLAKIGPSPRQPGQMGYAITPAGQAALDAELRRRTRG